jgi:ketosteroid isomerase-like protein
VDDTARNVEVVREFRAAFSSFDPARYGPFLAPEPVYHVGMAVQRGRAAFDQVATGGRRIYPHGSLRTGERRLVAQGDWVAVLVDREAVTNAGAHYENLYAMFYELRDGLVQTVVELLDFRIVAEKFDLGALAARPAGSTVASEPAVPAQRAGLPDPGDASVEAEDARTVLRFLDAFLTFDPDAYEDMLIADPLHRVGMTRREGRAGFREIAAAGRALYPHGVAGRTHHALVAGDGTVATLASLRATTNKGVDYENLYGMFFDVQDGRIAAMVEVLDTRISATAFDLSAMG